MLLQNTEIPRLYRQLFDYGSVIFYIKYGIYCEECDDRSCSECIKKVFRNEINADWTTNNSFNVNIKGGYETLYFTYADSKFTFICHT